MSSKIVEAMTEVNICTRCGSRKLQDRMEKISHNEVAHTANWCITALNEDNDALSQEIRRLKLDKVLITESDLKDYDYITKVEIPLPEPDDEPVFLCKFVIHSDSGPSSTLELLHGMYLAYPHETKKRVLSLGSDINDYLGGRDDE